MEKLLNHKLLGIPPIIWVLQLLYVALTLGLFVVLTHKLHKLAHQLTFQLVYVLIMVIINIAWRGTIKKSKPGWS